MTSVLTTPYAQLNLKRFPESANNSLQAFDAADEYLLQHLSSLQLSSNANCLVLNDSFGALAASLASHFTTTSSSDSFLAQTALYENLKRNHITQAVSFVPSNQSLTGNYDIVVIRIPKILSLLEEQLIRLQKHITKNTLIIAGGMIKHLPRTAGDLLEKYIGSVQASLAQKKARLLFCTPQTLTAANSPYPTHYYAAHLKQKLINHAGIFCREDLDIGTRAFLSFLPKNLGIINAADLGCGNGVLGISLALLNPAAKLTLIDESFMAVQSAQDNWKQLFPTREARIYACDGLANEAEHSFDLVICNPPFHQQQVIGDFLAKRMFKQAQTALKQGGELWIVGNRHLGYHQQLKNYFADVQLIGSTAKFVILKAVKA